MQYPESNLAISSPFDFVTNNISNVNSDIVFKPNTMPSTLIWMDGNDPSANGVTPANGSKISTWVDKSKNGHNFTQGTSARQPINANNFRNNKNAVRLGSAGFTQMDSSAFSLTNSFSMLVAFYVLNTQDSYIFNMTSGPFNPEFWIITQANVLNVGISFSANMTANISLNNFYIATYTFNQAGNAQLWLNGVLQGTTSTGGVSAAGSIGRRIGDSFGNTALYFNGYIGDLVLATGVWSTDDRRYLEMTCGQKWGIKI